MTARADHRGRSWLPVLAATVGGVLAFAAALAASSTLFKPSADGSNSASPTATASYSTPPAAEVKRIRDTLNDIAARCNPHTTVADRRHLDRDVDVVLAVARRYPNAEFPVEDETGHTLSLLLAIRDDLRQCAPSAAARVNDGLPSRFRDR